MWDLADVVTHVFFFVYANQSEFENFKGNLDETKVYTKKDILRSGVNGLIISLRYQKAFTQ